jgi:hypothetical protein
MSKRFEPQKWREKPFTAKAQRRKERTGFLCAFAVKKDFFA